MLSEPTFGPHTIGEPKGTSLRLRKHGLSAGDNLLQHGALRFVWSALLLGNSAARSFEDPVLVPVDALSEGSQIAELPANVLDHIPRTSARHSARFEPWQGRHSDCRGC